MLKQQKGMTLFALVFTIIAMLALAAVAIAMVLDELKYDPEPTQIYTEKQSITETISPSPEIITPTVEPELTDETPQVSEIITPSVAN